MRFRQVHLDFHTSEAIQRIGSEFNKKQFQDMLQAGHVDSITVFSKCHHGWAYHPSQANEIHPHLSFDLLGEMIAAAHEIDVKTPVYLSAGLDEKLARIHPEWLIRDQQDRTNWVSGFMSPGYHQFCFNSPYLEILTEQVKEVVRSYDADGIFLDIVGVRECYCHNCVTSIRTRGQDPRDLQAMKILWEDTYRNYTQRMREAVDSFKPGLPVFHNGGHITRGRRDLAQMNSHLEVESLPTGGWGYDHFPLSARYAQTLGMEFLGMTGKFHTSWGEFGGFKHPNALRYEASLSLANGARCSIGDQLHPLGLMDTATYELIGRAYAEVEAKEAWCSDTSNVADVALLTLEAVDSHGSADTEKPRTSLSDAGAVRILLEGNMLFDVVDLDADFHAYQVLILPDYVKVTGKLASKLQHFVAAGGKILATGMSGLNEEASAFVLDLGVKWLGSNPYKPHYFRPDVSLNTLSPTANVIYSEGQRVGAAGGTVLGVSEDSYFNRDIFTFCSHQHTPNRPEPAGPAMVEGPDGIYMAWNLFEEYATYGSLVLKEAALFALKRLLPNQTLSTSLPAQGIVTLQQQKQERRWINHLLYASPVKRGQHIEVIEDILPVYNTTVSVRVPSNVQRVYLAPQMESLGFAQQEGLVTYTLPVLECHQMVVLQFD